MRLSLIKILFACVALAGATYGIKTVRASYNSDGVEKRHQIEKLERDNEILQREIEVKKNRIERLQKNPDELKLEIEQKYKLVTPGTKHFILQDGTQSDDSAAPSTQPRRP